ncbi:MAG: DNA translocase FtsK 4TM domain-containing protein [Mariprofundaceae bacterium]
MQLRTFLREALAILLAGVTIILILALSSYAPADPSFNHATDHAVNNATGLVGAYGADMLYQLFGYVAWFFPLLLFAFGWRVLRHKQPWSTGMAALFWLPVLLGFASLLQAHDPSMTWPMNALAELPAGSGGALGGVIGTALLKVLHPLGRDVLLLALTLSCFLAASRLSLITTASRLGQVLATAAALVLKLLAAVRAWLFSRVMQLRGRQMRREAKPRKRIEPLVKAEVKSLPEPRISTRAAREKQVELAMTEPSRSGFKLPSLNLFTSDRDTSRTSNTAALQARARMLEKKLLDYGVEGRVLSVCPGPVVTQFEFEPAPGTKLSRISALQDDLARSLSAVSVRIAGNIPGKSVVGIEIPNGQREMVRLHQVLSSKEFGDASHTLPMALGVDIGGQPVVADLAKMPHLLVAGTTGSGKSVAVNGMICSMLTTHTPQQLRLILVDPKMLELSLYEAIPHLLVPVVTNPQKAAKALAWAVYEMERRYRLMSEARVRNIDSYNRHQSGEEGAERLPYIIIVIDELADLMMVAGREVEQSICRLAQKARAAGLHLILATQRPSVDVITGLIKANLPSRISFRVASKIDSRTILDQVGAEYLLGHGDMLFLSGGRHLTRVHGAFISDAEVINIVEHLKEQGMPEYHEEVFDTPSAEAGGGNGDDEYDERYDEAVALVVDRGQASVSMVQRHLRVGYNRACRMVERMEADGLISSPGSGGLRKVLAGVKDRMVTE